MIFETARLKIRYFVQNDFDDLFRMYSDPEVREFFPDGVRNAEETREELEWFLNGDPNNPSLGLWAAVHKQTGQFIGRCGLLSWDIDGTTEIEIAYMVDKAQWRQAYGSEMARGLVKQGFQTTDASHLIALTDPKHTASVKTAKAAGLTYWKDIFMDGVDSAVYKIDRSAAS